MKINFSFPIDSDREGHPQQATRMRCDIFCPRIQKTVKREIYAVLFNEVPKCRYAIYTCPKSLI